jgi:hypothetical protein
VRNGFGLSSKALLDKTNKENPRSQDIKALSDLLVGNKSLELWRSVASAGYGGINGDRKCPSHNSREGMLESHRHITRF